MGSPALLSRHGSPLHRCVFVALLVCILIASVHYLGFLPGRGGFTTTEVSSNNRLPQQVLRPPGKTDASSTGHLDGANHDGASPCSQEVAHLRALGLSRHVTYSRRCIKPVLSDNAERASVTEINSPFLTNTTKLDLDNVCSTDTEALPCHPLELAVPPPDPPSRGQYAHLVFGIATSVQRLRDSKATFAHWLADSGATLICLLTDDTQDAPGAADVASLEAEYGAAAMTLKLLAKHAADHSPEQSHTMVIADLVSFATTTSPTPHWLGILDDDTFVPSLHALSTELRRHDHTRPRYLGALSEDAGALRASGGILAAWGGAGVFLSLALAAQLAPHLAACLDGGGGGDMLIMQCVHAHSAARLTAVAGLWQMDFMGDTAGFYESGRRALSMHHWKSWHWLPAGAMAAVVRVCGDCFLRRFVFAGADAGAGSDDRPERQRGGNEALLHGHQDSDVDGGNGVAVLNVGYSINVYTGAEGLPDLSMTEQTWDGDRAWQDYEWSVGPLRAKVPRERKKTWWLRTAVHGQDGSLTQVYLHEGKGEGHDDEVIELLWQPGAFRLGALVGRG